MDRERWAALYETVCLTRAFELAVQRLVAEQRLTGLIHLSLGHEGVAAGVCAALGPRDFLFTGHRGHSHILARGADLYRTLAEILGKADGLCGGYGGSMHLTDMTHGAVGATGVVGGNLPLALGAALTARSQAAGGVAVVFFGDGATTTGTFHECLNLAALWDLPVLMVCENNGIAEFTPRSEHSRVTAVARFAEPYGIANRRVDGHDAVAVYEAAAAAVAELRRAPQPFLLECATRRLSGHFVGDVRAPLADPEPEVTRQWDPLHSTAGRLRAAGWSEERLQAIYAAAAARVEAAAARALQAPEPNPAAALQWVYAEND